jgi:2-keto-4-pentenoate hydratase/2-oxohepta-3-ene-1,7-dioic acid hydratase in catechol pathway
LRLFRYTSARGGYQPRLAVSVDGVPIDLIQAWNEVTGTRLDAETGHWLASTQRLIEEGPEVWAEVADITRAAGGIPALEVGPDEPGLRILSPIDGPPSLRDFLAFENHVKAGAERRGTDVPNYWYEAPVYYKGNHRSVIGPEDVCLWPHYTRHMDFELELALIVGVRGRDVQRDQAERHIFGFTVMNDFSARDIQSREVSAWLGPAKGKDFATALGPCIVTADEVGSEPDLEMICRVDGNEWGRARSSEMHWSWGEILAHVSDSEDVHPGDVLGSGTPGGCCGLDLGRRLQPGAVVELEIERIGVLRNRIGIPSPGEGLDAETRSDR